AVLLSAIVLASQGDATAILGQGRNSAPPAMTVESQQALINRYCAGCHNDKVKSGGFSWTSVDLAHPEQSAQQVDKVLKKLHSVLIPPPGQQRPDAAAMDSFVTSPENKIDKVAAARPRSKPPELHRVNRREYRNSVRDLLALDVDVSALLPPDARTGSFDNMADALTVNPTLMQAYVRAA